MIKEKLYEIEKKINKYGKTIYNKISQEELIYFQQWFLERYKNNTFEEYYEFTRMINGLDFNGLVIYSLEKEGDISIYDANEIWHENEKLKDYLFLADADVSWYCLNSKDRMYYELDKPSGEVIQSFKTFYEMIDIALSSVLL